ncbi:MAG: T9SS type A sorting domain-containing protein [Bacteroidota bacterium]
MRKLYSTLFFAIVVCLTTTQLIAQSGPGNCPDANADAGPDKALACGALQVNLDGATTTANAIIEWSVLPDSGGCILSGANTLTPVVGCAGCYILKVTNPAIPACEATDTVCVAGPPETDPPVVACLPPATALCLNSVAPAILNVLDYETASGSPILDANGPVTITAVDSVAIGNSCAGDLYRTYTFTDACGNSTTCQQIIAVADAVIPVISLVGPAGPIELGCNPTQQDILLALGAATVTDACENTLSATIVDDTTSTGCNYTVTRTWSVSDQCGQPAQSVSRSVNLRMDTSAPFVTCGAASTNIIFCDNGSNTISFNPTANDGCDGNLSPVITRSDTLPINAPFPIGTTTVIASATDQCNSTATCITTVTVNSTTDCAIAPPLTTPVCGSAGNTLTAITCASGTYSWSVSTLSPGDSAWVITSGANTSSITYTAGTGAATFVLTLTTPTDTTPVTSQCEVTVSCASSNGNPCIRSYTSDEDFNEGFLLSVNTSVSGSLRLDQPGQPLPYVNIACSGKGTVVRIDAITGQIIGEYLTAPAGMARNPSRTTVDKDGNCWVTNRDETSPIGGIPKGSVARIGVIIGGTRCNASGIPDPNGQYIKDPAYNTCIDRDGDGLIKTSFGLGNVLPWGNFFGVDSDGGVQTAEDEAITVYTRVFATGARTIAVDPFNFVWVGGSSNTNHEKLDRTTGNPIPGSRFNYGVGGYGGLIDGNGRLWSASNGLLRFETNPDSTNAYTVINGVGNYGLGIDPNTGEIWHTFVSGGIVGKISPSGSLIGTYSHGSFHAQGVAVDADSNVWVAHSLIGPATTVGHLRTDGTFVGNIPLTGSGPTGVAVDAFGKVWVSCYNSSVACRIDPNAGPIGGGGYPVGAVDLTVNLGANATPYNYSDMTGFVVINSTVPSGTWTVIHDGLASGRKWGQIDWTDSIPANTGIIVEARASNTELTLASKPWVQVEKGESFCCSGVTGRFIEVRATLFRQATVNVSPVLFDLTVQCCDIYPNVPPVITSSKGCGTQDTLKVPAGQVRTFTINGTDADTAQAVTLDVINLPPGAFMNPTTPTSGNPVSTVFNWSPTFDQLGIYNVTFTANDIYCYEDRCDKVIEVVPCPSISCDGAGISCAGLCNGQVHVALSGDPVGFTFLWNTTPPKTTADVYNLCPGTYKVYSTDGFACQDSCIITIPSTPCDGYVTYTQGGYGYKPSGKNPAMYVKNNFNAVFPSGLTIGCTNTIKLTNWQSVLRFLPSSGTPAALPAGNLVNPTGYKNTLAGQLVTAILNVGFDSANAAFAPAAGQLGDLVLNVGPFRGLTVRELIEVANRHIGGCENTYTYSQLNYSLTKINENYHEGTVNNCFLSCPINGVGSLRGLTIPQDESFDLTWSLVPNPASEFVRVTLQADSDTRLVLELLDASGRRLDIMYRSEFSAQQPQSFDYTVSGIPDGTYFVKVTGDRYNDIKRLVIVK